MATTENIAYLSDIGDTATVPSSTVPGNIVVFGEHPRELSDSGKKTSDFRLENDFSVGDGWILTLPDGKHVWLDRVSPDRSEWRSADDRCHIIYSATWHLMVDGEDFGYEGDGGGSESRLVFKTIIDDDQDESTPIQTYIAVRGSRMALDTDVSRIEGLVIKDSLYKIHNVSPDRTVVSAKSAKLWKPRNAVSGSGSDSYESEAPYHLPSDCFPITYIQNGTLSDVSLNEDDVEYRRFEGYDYEMPNYPYVWQIRVSRSVDEYGNRLPPDVDGHRVVAKFDLQTLAYSYHGNEVAYEEDASFNGNPPEIGVFPVLSSNHESSLSSCSSVCSDSYSSGSSSSLVSSSGSSLSGSDSSYSHQDISSGESSDSGCSSSGTHVDIVSTYTLLDRTVNVLQTDGDETVLELKLPETLTDATRLASNLVVRVGFDSDTMVRFYDSGGEATLWYDGDPTGVFQAGNHIFRILEVGDGMFHFADESADGDIRTRMSRIESALEKLLNGNISIKEYGDSGILHQLFAVKEDDGVVNVGIEQEGVQRENQQSS